MECRVLGPVEILVGGAPVPLGGAKPRALLAALLLERGRVVPVSRLIDIIWQQDPPDTARAVIQTYVKSLRQSLSKFGCTDVILTRAPGYLVALPDDALDLTRFERRYAEARTADSALATSELLAAALELWRGPALAGLGESLLASEAARLDELWLAATEQRITADLELGRHAQVLPELTALLGRFPTNERLRGAHMIALVRLGRQSEALTSFHEGRQVLVEELGVDPGSELTAIRDALLRGELGQHAAVVPAQLPLVPADFTGRRAEIAALVRESVPRARAWAPSIQILTGKGGSGKSALAARVAAELVEVFPDGQLYADLRGMTDTPAEPGEVLARFLKALGTPVESIPASTEDRIEANRALLARRRVLVLLDDAASESQVRPLLPTGACAALVTTRRQLGGIAGATRTHLDVLDHDDAVELLARIAGRQRVAAETTAAHDIVERCGRMPLAIRIAGARLATRHRWPLQLLANRLADERRRLDELAIADLEVRACFELSYRGLAERDRVALRRLGFLAVPEFAPWVLAWALDTDEQEAEEIVERLVDAHLVDFTRVDELGCVRYKLHELVRIYACERAEREELPSRLADVVAGVLGGWMSIVDLVAADSPPEEIQWRRTPVRRRTVSATTSKLVVASPQAWFDLEQPALVAGVERGAALGLHDLVREVASARLGPSFLGVNRYESRERMNAAALGAARRAGDRLGEAILLTELGHLRFLQDRFAESLRHQTEALGVFRDLGDEQGQAVALAGLGLACREFGRLPESLAHLYQAGVLARRLGDDSGMAYVTRLAGSVRLECGRLTEAWTDLTESLAAYRRTGSRRGEALALRSIGLHHRATGELERSITACDAAAKVFRELGDELMLSYAVRAGAKARFRLGRVDGVRAQLDRCLSVCETMGDRWGQALTLRTLGEFCLATGDLPEAEQALRAAMELWDGMYTPLWRARTLRTLAELHTRRDEHDTAAQLRAEAARVFRAHGAREYEEMAL